MIARLNPFALVRASDYTDEQINDLWVELGQSVIDGIIEPRSQVSKFILGGKGTGKTHLLRYHSYLVARLRHPRTSGLEIIREQGYLAIFLRATGFDAARFGSVPADDFKWQQLFGVYFELRLAEGLLDAICDIRTTSTGDSFNDDLLLHEISRSVAGAELSGFSDLHALRGWVVRERRQIDDAINNAAFTRSLEVRVPFAIGGFVIPLGKALRLWNETLRGVPTLFLVDEVENFSALQQQVLNSLIRYGEGLVTFRVTGRRYGVKTRRTLADGEDNREGAEFKTVSLDEILRGFRNYHDFARRFVVRRLESAQLVRKGRVSFDPRTCFEDIDNSNFYSHSVERLGLQEARPFFISDFREALRPLLTDQQISTDDAADVVDKLTNGPPLLLQKLNILLFCKKYGPKMKPSVLAQLLRHESDNYALTRPRRGTYAIAYGHYASDLFAQLCRQSKSAPGVPYAGFDTFVRMSSGNPRNLLILLGRAYENAVFRGIDFINGERLPLSLQTAAAAEAARFMLEADTNFGSSADLARRAVERLALVLRTARFSMNIPEVSPLAVSFSDADLTDNAAQNLRSALNYSFVFEVSDGRPDRNTQRLNRKIQLNPLLSPAWELPISRRGDLSLTRELANAIFDPDLQREYEAQLKMLDAKWNSPFRRATQLSSLEQRRLL